MRPLTQARLSLSGSPIGIPTLSGRANNVVNPHSAGRGLGRSGPPDPLGITSRVSEGSAPHCNARQRAFEFVFASVFEVDARPAASIGIAGETKVSPRDAAQALRRRYGRRLADIGPSYLDFSGVKPSAVAKAQGAQSVAKGEGTANPGPGSARQRSTAPNDGRIAVRVDHFMNAFSADDRLDMLHRSCPRICRGGSTVHATKAPREPESAIPFEVPRP